MIKKIKKKGTKFTTSMKRKTGFLSEKDLRKKARRNTTLISHKVAP